MRHYTNAVITGIQIAKCGSQSSQLTGKVR